MLTMLAPHFYRYEFNVYTRTREGFLMVYSITSRESFEKIQAFHRDMSILLGTKHFPMVLVGNKCDLEHERQIPADGLFSSPHNDWLV
jgi:GTPase SAR1 family protein